MKTRKFRVVVFPDTVAGDELLFPLVQVFSPVVHCRAVEEDEVAENLVTPLTRELEERGLCQVLVPAPLDGDRERFLTLVRDLSQRGEDYALQLKSLLLSGLGSGRGGERRTSIIDHLAGIHATDDNREREMLLWQARLLLKLGEQMDSEQRQLEQELERMREKEEQLLGELRREGEQPFVLTRELNEARSRSDGMIRLRLKAWSRLYCLGAEGNPQGQRFFVTGDPDARDLLLENAQRLEGEAPRPWLRILLPARGMTADMERMETLARDSSFVRLQEELATGQDSGAWADPDSDWGRLVESVFPEAEYGRRLLELHRCGLAPCTLFMETFGRDEDLGAFPIQSGEAVIGCLVQVTGDR